MHDDIRLINDASVEKEDSHAGKVLLRSWYERNKHIFPASRWEPFDPSKSYDKYTVSDRSNKKWSESYVSVFCVSFQSVNIHILKLVHF